MAEKDDLLFVQTVIHNKLATQEQAQKCLDNLREAQKEGKDARIQKIFIDRGVLSETQVGAVMKALGRVTGKHKTSEFGDFKVLDKLGEGGMGVVYRARQKNLDREVALKILPPRLAGDKSFVERFHREAKSAAKLNHTNIVQIYAAGESHGYHYMAMEYVEGANTSELLEREGVFSVEKAIRLLKEMADAFQHAHDAGLVHRDVKPDNIMVTRTGVAKLADLGLAKESLSAGVTSAGAVIGTPRYMSPEQADGRPDIDGRSDIYSLGVSVYHLVAGIPPFDDDSVMQLLMKHVNEKVPPLKTKAPQLSDAFCSVIDKMLLKNPDDRYQCGKDLLEDLELLERGQPLKHAAADAFGTTMLLDSASVSTPTPTPPPLSPAGPTPPPASSPAPAASAEPEKPAPKKTPSGKWTLFRKRKRSHFLVDYRSQKELWLVRIAILAAAGTLLVLLVGGIYLFWPKSGPRPGQVSLSELSPTEKAEYFFRLAKKQITESPDDFRSNLKALFRVNQNFLSSKSRAEWEAFIVTIGKQVDVEKVEVELAEDSKKEIQAGVKPAEKIDLEKLDEAGGKKLKAEFGKAGEELVQLNKELKRVTKQLQDAEIDLVSSKEKQGELEAGRKTGEVTLAELEKQIREVRLKKNGVLDLQEKKQILKPELDRAAAEVTVTKARSRQTELKKKVEAERTKLKAYKARLAQLKASGDTDKSTLEELNRQIVNALIQKKKILEMEARTEAFLPSVQEMAKAREIAKKKLELARAKLELARAERAKNEYERILSKVDEFLKGEKYLQASRQIELFPLSLRTKEWVPKLAKINEHIRSYGYQSIAIKVDELLADGKYRAAAAQVERFPLSLRSPDWAQKFEKIEKYVQNKAKARAIELLGQVQELVKQKGIEEIIKTAREISLDELQPFAPEQASQIQTVLKNSLAEFRKQRTADEAVIQAVAEIHKKADAGDMFAAIEIAEKYVKDPKWSRLIGPLSGAAILQSELKALTHIRDLAIAYLESHVGKEINLGFVPTTIRAFQDGQLDIEQKATGRVKKPIGELLPSRRLVELARLQNRTKPDPNLDWDIAIFYLYSSDTFYCQRQFKRIARKYSAEKITPYETELIAIDFLAACKKRKMIRVPDTVLPIGLMKESVQKFLQEFKDRPEEMEPGLEWAQTESPQRKVKLSTFFIGRTEVSNALYAKFLTEITKSGNHSKCDPREPEEKDHTPEGWSEEMTSHDKAELPVVGIDWFDAFACAAWLGCRLPTEAEWECAAAWNPELKQRFALFPWGQWYDENLANFGKLQEGKVVPGGSGEKGCPVKAHSFLDGASALGCLNLAGNVWEWSAQKLPPEARPKTSSTSNAAENNGPAYIVRGGSFKTLPFFGRNTARYALKDTTRRDDLGFRFAADPPDLVGIRLQRFGAKRIDAALLKLLE